MVQQIMEKFNEYKIINNGTGMATGDAQQRTMEKETTRRNLLSETRNTDPIAAENSPLPKNGGPVSESVKVSGTKRQQTSPACSTAASTSGTNGHLVYVRRKFDTESAKTNSPYSRLKKASDNCGSDPKSQPGSSQEVRNSLPVLATVPSAPNYSTIPTAISVQPETQRVATNVSAQSKSQPEVRRIPTGVPEPQRKRDQHWEERFLSLQMYLKSCDESSQEEYMQQLKSLSAAGRSKHAYDLERRAIHLMLEEAKELRRMMLLNVLGKALPDGHPSACSQMHTVE